MRTKKTKMKFTLSPDITASWLATASQHFPSILKTRAIDSNKGTFGNVAMIGSSQGMTGAIVLSSVAALYSGAGRVWLGFTQPTLPIPYITDHPELMLHTADDLLQQPHFSAIGIGCGMNTSTQSEQVLQNWLNINNSSLILDADALNIIAKWQTLPDTQNTRVLTPHPLEAARLLQCSVEDIQSNRLAAAFQIAKQYQTWVVLKGYQTIVANEKEWFYQNESGNAGLATAGSGDVLTGIISGLFAQGISPQEAICGGVWLHGAAADLLVSNGIGPIGLTAHELAAAIRWIRNYLVHQANNTLL